jgi:peptidoglycan/xylan/chitin deacetylase (PgdA/CDA1 family)
MMLDFMIGPSILMYHSIADNSHDPYTVTVDAFREQITWLSEHGFEVISLSCLLQSIQKRSYRNLRKKVVITFDDGYKDFLINALPILRDCNAPATVFLVTDMLGGSASWKKSGLHEPLMSEDEVRYIKSKGISLGSHTATHANLTLLDQEDMQRQLEDSHDKLSHLGESFYSFSYPWGQWSPQSVEAVKASGYECAVTVGEQPRNTAADAYFLPRIIMRHDINLKHFHMLLTRTSVEMEMRRRCRAFLMMGIEHLGISSR